MYQLESRADRDDAHHAARAGTAYLTFTRSGTDNSAHARVCHQPGEAIATKGRGSTCWVYAATLGGGLVGGDDIRLRVDVTAGARALLTTQASTKVYRSLRPASQSLAATVDRMRCSRSCPIRSCVLRTRISPRNSATSCTLTRASSWSTG